MTTTTVRSRLLAALLEECPRSEADDDSIHLPSVCRIIDMRDINRQ